MKRARTDPSTRVALEHNFMCFDYSYVKTFLAVHGGSGYTLVKLHERLILPAEGVRGGYTEEEQDKEGVYRVRHIVLAPHLNNRDIVREYVLLEYKRTGAVATGEHLLAELFVSQVAARMTPETACAPATHASDPVANAPSEDVCVSDAVHAGQ